MVANNGDHGGDTRPAFSEILQHLTSRWGHGIFYIYVVTFVTDQNPSLRTPHHISSFSSKFFLKSSTYISF